MTRSFSELSYKLTSEFSKDIKKNGGIYFTPPDTVNNTLDIIQEYSKYTCEWNGNILEPSCGSCEYVNELCKRFPQASITAIEYNKKIRPIINLENKKPGFLYGELKLNGYIILISTPKFLSKLTRYSIISFDLIYGLSL